MKKEYRLRYLPMFEADLAQILDYISWELKNPQAAVDLLNEVEQAIKVRLECPTSFETYHSLKEREHSYYRLYVKHYVVFYVVIGDIMEVRRILYGKRNLKKHV